MEDKPDGYYIPIHKSLVDPILIGGIDRNLCLGIWSVGVAIGVSVVVSVSVGAANAGVVIASASNIADAVFITLFIIISPFPNITLVYIYQF